MNHTSTNGKSSTLLPELHTNKTSSPTENNEDGKLDKQELLEVLRKKIQALQTHTLEQMEASLSEMTGQFLDEVEKAGLAAGPVDASGDLKYKNRVKLSGVLPEKHFTSRSSVLTDLFEVKHVRTIYNIFCVILFIVLLHTAMRGIVTTGTLNLGFDLIVWNFWGLGAGVCLWAAMNLATAGVYLCFRTWATRRVRLPPRSARRSCWDCVWLAVLLAHLGAFTWVPVWYLVSWGLRPALCFTLLMEQVRLMMKTYAFVRSNVPRAAAFKPHGDAEGAPCPPFRCFLYYLFAPTLVYRDRYPRTNSTDWWKVSRHLLDVVGVIFYVWFLFELFLIPTFRDFGRQPASAETVLVWTFRTMMPATVLFVCGFYCLLHCWMNAFAEMLRFADRMFYKDWWNCTSYADYFRTWNIVVHDWLYTYVYKDVVELGRPGGGSVVPTVMVFLLSALAHEYVLAFTFRFFCPVLLIAFAGFGMFMVFLPRDIAGKGNLLVWLLMYAGNGLITSAYCIEWYARINCKRTLDPVWDFVVPRSWWCEPLDGVSS